MLFLALIYLAFISLGLPDPALGSAWPLMYGDLDVPVGWAGFISAIISSGTIVSSLLSHRVIRRYGTGVVTVTSVGLTAVALLGFSISPSFWWLLLLAVPLGLGAGAVDSGLNAFVAMHYAARHMNWLHCFWGVGAMLGPILISTFTATEHSWRSGYGCISAIQFGLVALLLYSLPVWRRREQDHAQEEAHHPVSKHGLLAPLRVEGAWLALVVFLFYSAIEGSVMLWGATFLVEAREVSPEQAAGWISLFFLGLTAGRALSGFVSIKLSNENLIILGCGILVTGLVLMLLPLPASVTLLGLMMAGLGLSPIFPAMLHQTPVHFGKRNTSASMGLQMACAYTGATVVPPLLGFMLSSLSFNLMPHILLVSAVGLFFCATRLFAVARNRGA